MFNNPTKSKEKTETSKEQNRISSGTVITGDIEAKGGFRIEGTLIGNLTTSGKVVISKGGLIKGNLTCQHADFEGNFDGKLNIEETLSLRSSAVVDGEVNAGKLSIEPGALFNASCEMKGSLKAIKKDDQKQKERSA
ncbi:cytoskeletal protein CcmA (bactofilin family) [Gillisia sp. Hel_I_86]|uniref:bactofilin family protein n=1 Tax=Gillisia sp. Hel_I_86 TaxID=1249981 RepID=UPI00119941CC|nr:polymer-forming cytoskeletal protein [Gillisia sp. Hel_I_86]TVZ26280.1 cytoskeletal protein CcmA (bactofilin family) [Gillisia sp. Hel_I_86]